MRVSLETNRHVGGLRVAAALLVLLTMLGAGNHAAAQDRPVVSFEALAPEGAETPAPVLSFSFRFAPWEQVLTKFADVAGLTLDLTEVPSGTFNYYDKGQYSPREALDVLNGYLLQRGFVLVRRDRFLVCVNLQKGIPANLIPMVTVDQLAEYGNNELISVILSQADMDASLAASQIEQLQGAHGKVLSLEATNSLLVTDTGSNLRLINRLLRQGAFTRRTTAGTGVAFKSFVLQRVRAAEAERLIRTLFGLPPAAGSAKAPAAGRGATGLSITADSRTNQLFVTATSATLTSIEQILAAFDVADTADDVAPERGTTTTRIVPLPNADVITIGRTLESLSPRIRVSTTRSARGANSASTIPKTGVADKADAEPMPGNRPNVETPKSPDGRDR